jgi:diguanylate cyclase (GGDEF)-like protein
MFVVIAAGTAIIVALAGGGSAFWLSTPAALLACGLARSRQSGIAGAALAVAAAAIACSLVPGARPIPSAAAGLFVPAASVAIMQLVRARAERERERLRHSALSDPLTGIANRRSLLSRIDYEIPRHARARHGFALVMVDLDGFKLLNDRFGHEAGDDLLRDVAAALRRTLRSQDTAARIGGDEFCVLAPETNSAGVPQLEARVLDAIVSVTAGMESVRASVGTAVFPRDGRAPQELMRAADQRLLAAKRALTPARRYRRAA